MNKSSELLRTQSLLQEARAAGGKYLVGHVTWEVINQEVEVKHTHISQRPA